MSLKVHLLIIDPQNDFMGEDDSDPNTGLPIPYTVSMGSKSLKASLPVKGATSDMHRAAGLIDRVGPRLDRILVSLDSHRVIDVSHPGMWRNDKGENPPPFTIIGESDILNNIWYPRNPKHRARLLNYVRQLAIQGNYPLLIWTEHCLIGTWGHNVYHEVADALQRWERKEFANVDYIVKGTNVFTEHFGALQAEVPDPEDRSTQLNIEVLQTLQAADIVALMGEAKSHCDKETIKQIATHIGEEHIKKFHVIEDCMSPVGAQPGGPDFPAIADAFFADMAKRGMTLTTSAKFLA